MKTLIPRRWQISIEHFWLVDDPAVIAAAAPGEQPWRAVLIEEGIRTTDRRMVTPNALSWRDLPLTLGYQGTTPSGFNPHGDAAASGRIETIERIPHPTVEGANRLLATGAFTADDDGRRAAESVRSQKVRGISADVEAIEVRYEAEIDAETGDVVSETEVLDEGRVMGAIVTPHPAFADATIEVDGDPIEEEAEEDLDEAIAASASRGIDSGYFDDPLFERLTPFTVESIPGLDGSYEIFGHIAPHKVCHLGLPGCRTAPLSASEYAYFHTKGFETTDKGKIGVGVLTMGGLHTDLHTLANTPEEELRRSFEDMETVVGFVRAGEDAFGIWVHGVTRMGVTPETVELMNGSNPSGEWKPIKGKSELVRVHGVPVGGFPVPRVLVASALYRNGELVAYRSAGVPRDPECEEEVEPIAASGLPSISWSGSTGSTLPTVASTFEAHNETLKLILDRLGRIESTQAAMVKFGSFDVPDKL